MKQLVTRFGGARRVLVMALVAMAVGGMALAGDPPAPTDHILTQQDFTGLATQILTYLGYAVIAGLSILVAVVGARRAWSFMRRFL